MVGALMFMTEQWSGAGVFNVEEFNPDPFPGKAGSEYGLPWHELKGIDLELD